MHIARMKSAGLAALLTLGLGLSLTAGPAFAEDPAPDPAPAGQLALTGNVSVHDPTMAYDEVTGLYVVAATHNSIRTAPTMNGPWTSVGSVTRAPWTTSVPNSSTLWAPHLQKIGDTFYYYYSQSSFGVSNSAIGVKTTKTPHIPSSYVDLGRPIVTSGTLATGPMPINYNAIDPVVQQDEDGAWWMIWGSFWDGIVAQQLGDDLVSVVGTPTLLASRRADDNPVEGPAIFFRDGFYYLVLSWDKCCAGASSTYKVAVGRSESITGPYVDQAGVRLDQGGGSVILDTRTSAPGVTPAGLYRAPGGADVYTEDDVNYLVYHAYLPNNTLGIRPMEWRDGWPYFSETPGSSYNIADGDHVRLVSEAKNAGANSAPRVAGPTGFGSAIQLNGTSRVGYVDMPDGIVSDLDGDFTISTWVKRGTTQGNDWARIFDFGSSSDNFMFMTPASGAAPTGLRVDARTANGVSQTIPGSGNSVSVSTAWTHVAVSASGTTGKLWVNGQLVRENTNFTQRPADLGFTLNNWIGRSQFSADPGLNASVDDFNIFSRQLSAAEMMAMTTAPGGGAEVGGGDVAWYRFDEAGGNSVIDSSGSDNGATAIVPAATGDELQNPVAGTQCLTASATALAQAACVDGAADQSFRVDEADGGNYRLVSRADRADRCVSLADDSGEPGTPIELAACEAANSLQEWFIEDTGHGFLRFSSPATNLALEIANVDGVIGADIVGAVRAIRPIANLDPPQQWQAQHVAAPQHELALTAVAATRCVAGKVALTVKETNADDRPVRLTVTSAYGAKDVANLEPGKSVSQVFSTRQQSVPAGTANIAVAPVAGGPGGHTVTVAYPATDCS
ncbi:family 43 glycosylhydrolase [Microbacterium sp. CFBP9034]|uniref:family 43 glycosylhydrolase n=1 Tax=Microbacterium sp. CFBP9034 TaxID=3096540 RepID=UPI002A6AE772|nr:family 43 glycosylhydrolase [Microbacterium sp. CFBP9034]MDY0911190.1 family 43 glycosylhydrolase [Microbacterium sp. CFBP9034]